MFEFLRGDKYPRKSLWSVHIADHDGKPLLIRRNDSARRLAGDPRYGFRVGVAIPFKTPNENGMPGEAELEELNDIEDALKSGLEADRKSLLVLSLTTGGMREFVFQTCDPEFARSALATILAKVTTHRPQGYVKEDPTWEVFESFSAAD